MYMTRPRRAATTFIYFRKYQRKWPYLRHIASYGGSGTKVRLCDAGSGTPPTIGPIFERACLKISFCINVNAYRYDWDHPCDGFTIYK